MAILNKNLFLIELSESPKTSLGKVDFNSQTPVQKVFSTIWSIESEINNGGFKQYFCNSSAETAGSLVDALTEIKAPDTAKICARAIAIVFPKGLPSTQKDISDSASKIDDKTCLALEKLDKEFCCYPHDLAELLYDFVVSHPAEFSTVQPSSKPSGLWPLLKKLFGR
jgi:Domain of unknown function (DUF4375)